MARDKYHFQVREALEKDGWSITHDPYKIALGRSKGYIDLGAEIIGAEKENIKIAVEIKSFLGVSDLDQFENALGQFLIYLFALETVEPHRSLFLAVPFDFYERFFSDAFFQSLIKRYDVKILSYDHKNSEIIEWIK